MPQRYDISIARAPADLDDLAEEWDSLQQPWQMPMLDYHWVRANGEHFYAPGDLHVVVARRAGDLAAVAPLARVRAGSNSWIEFIGASHTPGPSGILYRNLADLDAMAKTLWRMREPMILRRWVTEEQIALTRGIRMGRRGLRVFRSTSRIPTLAVQGSWEDFLKQLSAQRRYDVRRARRRLETHGPVAAIFQYPQSGHVDEHLDRAFSIEASSWKGRKGTAIKQVPRLEAFLRSMAKHYAARGELVVALLLTGETPVAMQFGIIRSGRYWVLKVGYDEAWRHASPGSLLMTEAVRYAHEQGLARVEFLGKEEPWLRGWTKEAWETAGVHFLPYGWAGARALVRLIRRNLA